MLRLALCISGALHREADPGSCYCLGGAHRAGDGGPTERQWERRWLLFVWVGLRPAWLPAGSCSAQPAAVPPPPPPSWLEPAGLNPLGGTSPARLEEHSCAVASVGPALNPEGSWLIRGQGLGLGSGVCSRERKASRPVGSAAADRGHLPRCFPAAKLAGQLGHPALPRGLLPGPSPKTQRSRMSHWNQREKPN